MNKGKLAEEYVNQLSYKSYLKYWCYPNPCDEDGDRKEICDLLILCKDICIIISVKDYHLNGNYERYKKHVIQKSTKQLYGAERKLFNPNRPITIKHPDRNKEIFNKINYHKIYRLTINLGDQFEYYELIDYNIGKATINIFNKETIENIFKELDTLSDLVEYLEAREQFLMVNLNIDLKGSESDLLAIYLLNKHSFPPIDSQEVKFIELNFQGAWNRYDKNHNMVKDKRLANRQSYFIDYIIQNNILNHDWGPNLANELIYLSRMQRRILAQNMFELIYKHENDDNIIARRYIIEEDTMYLFIYYPVSMTLSETDQLIENAGYIYMYKTNFIHRKIIILAATKKLRQWKYGLVIQEDEMSSEAKKYWGELCESYGWFKNMVSTEKTYKEYPNEPDNPELPYKINS